MLFSSAYMRPSRGYLSLCLCRYLSCFAIDRALLTSPSHVAGQNHVGTNFYNMLRILPIAKAKAETGGDGDAATKRITQASNQKTHPLPLSLLSIHRIPPAQNPKAQKFCKTENPVQFLIMTRYSLKANFDHTFLTCYKTLLVKSTRTNLLSRGFEQRT
ncbi:hypothetical protein BCR34DRAFT_68964 [Clohesyomyces aquaticus]|uniref:Uncharacterized protein n=1 Tax=Clohesyomyces aquaticus TaxID=1231657 RepID=A0A1Y1Z1E5_9PLEO|nr:hypothetical protein BCR34DRAFT_68964 [Clohesyomyces aquaticus]